MKEISLTRGFSAMVSDEDYLRIAQRNWFACVNVQVRAARMDMRRMVYMQHEVLETMPWELQGKVIDHIDRNPLNNCRTNLRIVTQAENMQNTARSQNRKGYAYSRRAGLWMSYLDLPGLSRKYLGYSKTEEEARAKVQQALHG